MPSFSHNLFPCFQIGELIILFTETKNPPKMCITTIAGTGADDKPTVNWRNCYLTQTLRAGEPSFIVLG